MVANVNSRLFLLVGLSAALLLTFAFTSLNEDASLTGQVLGAAPAGASTLDVYLGNYTVTLNGASRTFTALHFSAMRGGRFQIPGVFSNQKQFYLVLQNQTPNAAAYVGKIVYGATNTSTTGATSSFNVINFNHLITYNTSNRTLAHSPSGLIHIQGYGYRLSSSSPITGFSGGVNIFERDSNSSSTKSGNWSIPFSQNGFGQTYFNLNGTHVTSGLGPRSVIYNLKSGLSFNNPVFVGQGFTSPAEVNLTVLRQFELRLTERANPLATRFDFSCSDSDGNNRLVEGSLGLVYPGRTVELYRDSCILNSTSPVRYTNIEGLCPSYSLFPQYYSNVAVCASTCNAAGTACAS